MSFVSQCCVVGLMALCVVAANAQSIRDKQDDQRILSRQHLLPPIEPSVLPTLDDVSRQKETTISLDEKQLKQHPDIVVRAIMAALLNSQVDDVAFFLPFYKELPKEYQEPMILQWASAMVAQSHGHYRQAIQDYQSLIESYPQAALIRLHLAQVLFLDKQWLDAKEQFYQLQKDNTLPADVTKIIEQYLAVIDQQTSWTLTGGINFLQDKNINNAPKNRDLGGGWTAPQRESATGLGFFAGAHKKTSLADGFYVDTRLNTQAKYYWDNKRYNEVTARISSGFGLQNARWNAVLLPFVEQNYYADGDVTGKLSTFSGARGVTIEGSYKINAKWQGGAYAEVADQQYRTRQHLNGLTRHIGVSAIYTPNAQGYWFAGLDYQQTNARDADDSFMRKGVRVGVGQEWQEISGRISASYGKKSYRGIGFFGKIQRNDDYGLSASIWHNQLNLLGMTPRLTWQYQKVDSNIPLYQYNKHHVFVEMSRQF